MTVARLYQPNKALTDYKQCSDMSLTYNSCWYNSGWILQVKKMDKNETLACSETQTLYHRLNSMYRNQVFYDLYQKDPPIRLGQNAKQTGNNLTDLWS